MYRISVAIANAGQGGKTEIHQEARFSSGDPADECLEMDCVWALLHEQLISRPPGNADQQHGPHPPHYPVQPNRSWAKPQLPGPDHGKGAARNLKPPIPD